MVLSSTEVVGCPEKVDLLPGWQNIVKKKDII